MFGLPVATWERLALWLVVGLAFYFLYGVRHSRLAASAQEPANTSVPLTDGQVGVIDLIGDRLLLS